MKQAVRPLVMAAFSLTLVQSMHPTKQKVFASKADNLDREVEVKIIGWNEGQPISSSKFKKNTTGLRTNALYLDLSIGYRKDQNLWNKIDARYTDGQGPDFQSLEVFSAPKDAKIKLESGKIRLVAKNGQDVSQVPGKPETLNATIIQMPTGSVRIISGDYTLDKNKVDSQTATAPGVLDSVEYNNGTGGPIKIFKDRLTKIYVKKPSGDSVIVGLHALDIKKSGDKPILLIDEHGRALLSHMPPWKTAGKKASVAPVVQMQATPQQPAAEKSASGKSEQGQQTTAAGESSDIPWLIALLDQRKDNRDPNTSIPINKKNAKLRGLKYAGANLSYAKLPGADLSHAQLPDVSMWGADLADANLESAQLKNFKAGYANLSHANLQNANLSQDTYSATHYNHEGNRALRNVNFTRANLTSADLSKANCYAADFTGATLTSANIAGADFTRAIITEEQKKSARGA